MLGQGWIRASYARRWPSSRASICPPSGGPQYLEDVAAAVKTVRKSGERGVFNPSTY